MQSPFVTLFLHIDETSDYTDEVAMIVEEIIRQRIQGVKNKDGKYVTPAFPKLIYVLDENNNLTGGKYDYITKLCIQCNIKRMYPDYISAKIMRENYDGEVFSPMGCVDGQEVVSYKYKGIIHVESFERMWNRLAVDFLPMLQTPDSDLYKYMELKGVEIKDTKAGYVDCKGIIRNTADKWVKVTLSTGHVLDCTIDHPFDTENKGIVHAEDLNVGDTILTDRGVAQVTAKDFYSDIKFSYDVTTESEHFEVSGIYSHNCRSFLSPWKKTEEYVHRNNEPETEIGKYKWEGRFNQGVISINLPQIGIEAGGDMDKFWQMLDERLSICYKALLLRHSLLEGTLSDTSPLHWQDGAIARLKQGEKIDELLHNGYSTLSLGYIGIYETVQALIGKSHTTPEGEELALKIMKKLRNACDQWKAETGLGFGLYGTPAESLCYTFARHDLEKYGSIPNVTDHGFYTNSYHVFVQEKINAFDKFKFESQFQKISSGGAISYIEMPYMMKNPEALEQLVKFIYNNIQYAEFNTKSDYCYECGFEGEVILNKDNHWQCPRCGNTNMRRLIVTRRTCGYLGLNDWNEGKRKEMGLRRLHL